MQRKIIFNKYKEGQSSRLTLDDQKSGHRNLGPHRANNDRGRGRGQRGQHQEDQSGNFIANDGRRDTVGGSISDHRNRSIQSYNCNQFDNHASEIETNLLIDNKNLIMQML